MASTNKRLAQNNKPILSGSDIQFVTDWDIKRWLRYPQLSSQLKGIPLMLKFYEDVKRLSTDQDGVVSFEYVIVAACVVGAVVAAFGTGSTGAIGTALTNAIAAVVALSLGPR